MKTSMPEKTLTAFIDAINRRESADFRERCQQRFGEQWKREWAERKAKTASAVALCVLAIASVCPAQFAVPGPIPNDTVTGTTQYKLVKYNTTASATSVIITATTDTTGAVGICGDGCGTSGKASVITLGQASCIFDNSVSPNDYVQISSTVAGDCHDAGATRPTSGQIIGTVFGAGGSAGTYKVSLNKDIYPASAATAPVCNVIGSSDTITAAGAFATTCPVSGLVQGSFLEIRAHGVLTTTATANPIENIQVNAGGTTGLCTRTQSNSLSVSTTNVPWDVVCYIHILTAGAPGTATIWGTETAANTGASGTFASHIFNPGAATQSFTTNSAQTVSLQEIATLVSGTSITLQSLIVRNY